MRRHARLVDYPFHDGANARAWIAATVAAGDDGTVLPAGTVIAPGEGLADTSRRGLEDAVARGTPIFETIHDLRLHTARNEIGIHTWGDPACCLPARGDDSRPFAVRRPRWGSRGATCCCSRSSAASTGRVTERRPDPPPRRPPGRGTRARTRPARRGRRRRHPLVRRRRAAVRADGAAMATADPRAVVRGNVVLADHGRTHVDPPVLVAPDGAFRPSPARGPVTQGAPYDPAAARRAARRLGACGRTSRDALPRLWLDGEGVRWEPRRDLLASDRFASDFVVEMEEDGRGRVRFGDDVHGRRPTELESFTIGYRVGTGPRATSAPRRLVRVRRRCPPASAVRNPLPAIGGTAPEPLEHARLYAPQAFRRQERAVTEADYARMAERHPEVQRAAATRRWTGSWHTMFVTVDRRGGPGRRRRLRGTSCDASSTGTGWPATTSRSTARARCRSTSRCGSASRPATCAATSRSPSASELSVRDLPRRPARLLPPRPAHLRPDRCTSRPVVAAAMAVAGRAERRSRSRFQRWREPAAGELALGRLATDAARDRAARQRPEPARDRPPRAADGGRVVTERTRHLRLLPDGPPAGRPPPTTAPGLDRTRLPGRPATRRRWPGCCADLPGPRSGTRARSPDHARARRPGDRAARRRGRGRRRADLLPGADRERGLPAHRDRAALDARARARDRLRARTGRRRRDLPRVHRRRPPTCSRARPPRRPIPPGTRVQSLPLSPAGRRRPSRRPTRSSAGRRGTSSGRAHSAAGHVRRVETIYLAGTATGLRDGDVLLLAFAGPTGAIDGTPRPRLAHRVVIEGDRQRTRVELAVDAAACAGDAEDPFLERQIGTSRSPVQRSRRPTTTSGGGRGASAACRSCSRSTNGAGQARALLRAQAAPAAARPRTRRAWACSSSAARQRSSATTRRCMPSCRTRSPTPTRTPGTIRIPTSTSRPNSQGEISASTTSGSTRPIASPQTAG